MSEAAKLNRFAAKSMQSEPSNVKALRIKVNALRRTVKDLAFAEKEVDREMERLACIKETNPDRVPQQENVLNEAKMMVPHAENRIRSAVKEIRDFLEKDGMDVEDEELRELATTSISEGEMALVHG